MRPVWVYLAPPAMQSLALQIGRQNINGTREWWWDEDLDPEQEDVLRVLARAG